MMPLIFMGSMVSASNISPAVVSFEFKNLIDEQFIVVNDSVMGGRSVSELQVLKNAALYRGDVSLKNNGGFASVRMIWPFDEVSKDVVKLKVQGDGKSYQLRFRTDKGFNGAAYGQSFQTTKGITQTFTFNVSDFVPTYRGRVLRNMPKLDLLNVEQFGIMVADKQIGDFELSLLRIELDSER